MRYGNQHMALETAMLVLMYNTSKVNESMKCFNALGQFKIQIFVV